jgi:hypothetical protein
LAIGTRSNRSSDFRDVSLTIPLAMAGLSPFDQRIPRRLDARFFHLPSSVVDRVGLLPGFDRVRAPRDDGP